MNIYEDNLYLNLRERYIQMAIDTPSAERVIGMMDKVVENHDTWPADKTGRWVGYVQCILIEVEKVTTINEERNYTRPFFHEIYRLAGYDIPETVEV